MRPINAVSLPRCCASRWLPSLTSRDRPNGGQVKHSGKYHMELVVKDTALTVYVTGAKTPGSRPKAQAAARPCWPERHVERQT